MYRLLIHTQSPCVNDLGMINWGCLKRSVFPAKPLNVGLINCQCLSRPLYLSLSGFFLYCFLSQHRSMVAARLNQCTAYQRLDRGGVDFPSKTTALITWEMQYFSFLEALRTCTFLALQL